MLLIQRGAVPEQNCGPAYGGADARLQVRATARRRARARARRRR
eukprot:COSAG01_NODE_8330_length_2826_cov_17.633297_1_plen_43_part_10